MTLPTPVRLSTLPVGARFGLTAQRYERGEFSTKLDDGSVRMPDGWVAPAYGDPEVYPAPDTTEAT